jgi:hypothetical protein
MERSEAARTVSAHLREFPVRRLFGLAVVFTAIAVVRADDLFTYFTMNGKEGLHLATSTDGYAWERLKEGRSFLAPRVGQSKLMRDPCVVRGPDGTFHGHAG